jgi:NADH:ubiquinone oxidoreductase subunit 6 (subunit J)
MGGINLERYQISAVLLSFLLLVVLSIAFIPANWGYVGETAASTASISYQMFDPGGYGITFLIVALLLAASMIGGVYLAKEE